MTIDHPLGSWQTGQTEMLGIAEIQEPFLKAQKTVVISPHKALTLQRPPCQRLGLPAPGCVWPERNVMHAARWLITDLG